MTIIKHSLALLLLTTILTGCGDNTDKSEATKEDVAKTTEKEATKKTEEEIDKTAEKEAPIQQKAVPVDAPTYKVGIIVGFEPYTFRNEDNEIIGFNIDLTNAVAAEEGFKVEYRTKKWDPEFTDIQSGKLDFIGSSVTVLPERDKIIDYSNQYVTTSIDLAVKDELKDNTFNQIVTDSSLKYGVMTDTSFVKYALKVGIKESMLKKSESSFTSIHDVINGSVDAAFADGQSLKYYTQHYPEINIVSNTNDISTSAYVVQEGNIEMQSMLNSGLAKVRESGEYDTIYTKWFGK